MLIRHVLYSLITDKRPRLTMAEETRQENYKDY